MRSHLVVFQGVKECLQLGGSGEEESGHKGRMVYREVERSWMTMQLPLSVFLITRSLLLSSSWRIFSSFFERVGPWSPFFLFFCKRFLYVFF